LEKRVKNSKAATQKNGRGCKFIDGNLGSGRSKKKTQIKRGNESNAPYAEEGN